MQLFDDSNAIAAADEQEYSCERKLPLLPVETRVYPFSMDSYVAVRLES
ncbi:MAG: hypothetical protein JWQ21_1233 [Herminiimonas sp.]|nr:hypothetical protein [Herminiimonas sp.]